MSTAILRPALLLAAAVLFSLGGCAAKRPLPEASVSGKDIHDRISIVSSRHGFDDGLRTLHDSVREVDYTVVRFPLDGVKTRHYSLENLLKGIGGVLAQPEFAGLPIRIEIRAEDEADRIFLRDALTRAIAGKAEVDVRLRPAAYSGMVIAAARGGGH